MCPLTRTGILSCRKYHSPNGICPLQKAAKCFFKYQKYHSLYENSIPMVFKLLNTRKRQTIPSLIPPTWIDAVLPSSHRSSSLYSGHLFEGQVMFTLNNCSKVFICRKKSFSRWCLLAADIFHVTKTVLDFL